MRACTCRGRMDCPSCFGLGFQVTPGEETPGVSLTGLEDGTIAVKLLISKSLPARMEELVRIQGLQIERAWSRTRDLQVLAIGRAIIQYLIRAQ